MMAHRPSRASRFEVRRILGLPRRGEVADETQTYPLELVVVDLEEATLATFTLDVSTPAAFPTASRPTVLSERGRLVVRELDGDRIRNYLRSLVRSCTEPTLHAARPVFARYFVDAEEAATPPEANRRRRGILELQGFDPGWEQPTRSGSWYLTFGVAPRHEAVDTELTVSIVTPVTLAAQSSHGAFVLAHRATIVVSELDWALVEAHLRDLVERRCAAPSLEHALASLQRYVRIPWETSLSRLMPMDSLDP